MVQFLSIIFFLEFPQFLLGFSKVPVFFLCHPVFVHADRPEYKIWLLLFLWVRIAQLTQNVATSWKVRGSNTRLGEVPRTSPEWPWDLPNLLQNGYRIPFLVVKRKDIGVDQSSHPNSEVKKEQSYASTPLPCLHCQFKDGFLPVYLHSNIA